jgi:cinnamyl-alcohol dehydrogenase
MPCNRKELDPGNAAQPDVGGSGIGGIKETQKMVDFCGKHNITCMIEKIPMSYLNTAME